MICSQHTYASKPATSVNLICGLVMLSVYCGHATAADIDSTSTTFNSNISATLSSSPSINADKTLSLTTNSQTGKTSAILHNEIEYTRKRAKIDKVLAQLQDQHNNASPLIKQTRQSQLSLNSRLITTSHQPIGTSSIQSNQTINQPVDSNADLLTKLSGIAAKAVRKFKQSGVATWYGRQFQSDTFGSNAQMVAADDAETTELTAAHRSLPLACYIRVTNDDNGQSVIVKVNGRKSQSSNSIVDLSYAAAKQIGILQRGYGNVSIERVDSPID